MKISHLITLPFLLAFLSCSHPERSGPDNIVLILADDFGYECLSLNGNIEYFTPNIDLLAAEGMVFNFCYAQPLCTPSRVQIMTGKYNFRNYKQFGYLDMNELTFAYYLKKAGYATCITGKWQLDGGIEAPHQAGFDDYCLWQIYNQITQTDQRGSRYADPKYYINGKVFEDQQGLYGPDVFTQFGLDFIEKHRDVPFFLYYPMVLTHDPFCPTPASADWEIDRHAQDTSYFSDMVSYTDRQVNRIWQQLKELNLEDQTWLFFTGDNGTARSIFSQTTAGLIQGGKSLTHEYGIHVPLIVHAPGRVSAGVVSDALVDFTDFLPTFLSIAGESADNQAKVDGYSLLPNLLNNTHTGREVIYGYYWGRGRNPLEVYEYVRDHEFKLYRDGRLYRPADDPEEKNDLGGLQYDSVHNRLLEQMNHIRLVEN